MNPALEVVHVPNPAWSYEDSVAKMRPLVFKWKNLTVEMLSELRTAREMLRDPGRRSDLGANEPELPTWEGYCLAVGIAKSTANRWLWQFEQDSATDPEEKPPKNKKPEIEIFRALLKQGLPILKRLPIDEKQHHCAVSMWIHITAIIEKSSNPS